MLNQIPNDSKRVLIILLFLGLGSTLVSFCLSKDSGIANWWAGLLQNFGTEIFGAVVTFFLIDLVVGIREKTKEQTQERRDSQIRSITRLFQAQTPEDRQLIINEMQNLGILRGADLRYVNLSNLFLSGMDLRDANLSWGTLNGTDLTKAQLQGANLSNAELKGCVLEEINLQRSTIIETKFNDSLMIKANLSEAEIHKADFSGTNLTGSSFKGATMTTPLFNQTTKLPNGATPHDERELIETTN